MENESIKNAINKHLKKNNIITENFYSDLSDDAETIKSLRLDVDKKILSLKINIIKSNLHLLIDKIFKEDTDGVINMLKGIKDKTIFFDFTENFTEFLILFECYLENYEFNSPDLSELKEVFALNDTQLCELIKEINLDKE
jgi:hypothetical protein